MLFIFKYERLILLRSHKTSGTIIEIHSLFTLCIKITSRSIHCEYRMIIDEIGKLEQELIRI